jgi:peptide/nickel transport system substrate-binding protein
MLARSARNAVLLAASLSALVLAGCGGPGEKGGETPPNVQAGQAPQASPGNTRPQRGGTAVVSWIAAPVGVNEVTTDDSAITTELIRQLFLHLVEEQPDFEVHPPTLTPQLATSFDWSPDHKVLTFRLREDVVWSDGVPVTADDVRWTWQAQVHPAVAWGSAYMKEHIKDVEVVDPHTVRFHFTHPYAKQILDANEGVILPKHAWEKLPFSKWRESSDWFQQNLIVDGPFKVATWQPGQDVVLVRNERYYRKDRPWLDKVVVRNTPDASSQITQLFSGDSDFVPQIQPGDVERIKADPRLQVIPYWFRLFISAVWNLRDPRFADADVRRALTLAIDRQTIVDTLFSGGAGRVAVSPIVQSVWAFDRTLKPLPYDPAQARRILESRGWKDTDGDGVLDKDGKPFSFVLLSNAGNQQRNDAAVMIQDQLKKVGIRVEPRVVEFNSMISNAMHGTFEAMIFGFAMDTSLDMTGQFGSKSTQEGNFGAYNSPEFDRLMAEAMSKPDIQDARPLLDRIQQLIHRDQPMTFLWESQRLSAVNRRLHDVKPTVLFSLFNLEDWWVGPAR